MRPSCGPTLGYVLADVAAILNGTGPRPDELHRLRREDITFVNGRYGALSVCYGKTDAARRTLPMTPRVRYILEARHVSVVQPTSGWIFPAPSKSDHVSHSSSVEQEWRNLREIECFGVGLLQAFGTRLLLASHYRQT